MAGRQEPNLPAYRAEEKSGQRESPYAEMSFTDPMATKKKPLEQP
jgi:hypothetical protein